MILREFILFELYKKFTLTYVCVCAAVQGMRNRERRGPHVNVKGNNMNMRKQQGNGKVCDVTEQPRSKQLHQHDVVPRSAPPLKPKPVDEDLYKIPPELLRTTKRVR